MTNSPVNVGFDQQRLARVKERLESDIADDRYDGAILHVARGGETVLECVSGYADRSAGRVLTADTPIFTMSVGKQFTVAVVLYYVERGLLSLTTRVADIIPAYGCRGKEDTQLWHLLTHTSGVISQSHPLPIEVIFNLEAFVEYISGQSAENPPGSRVNYSLGAGHAVLGEMVRRVDGGKRSFRDIQREVLFDPLGMHDTHLGLPADVRTRMAPVVAKYQGATLIDPAGLVGLGQFITPEAEMPSGGFVSTISDLARFAEMLRNRGALNVGGREVRILSPGMIDYASRVHTGTMHNGLFDYAEKFRGWPRFPADLGLGFFLRGETLHPSPFGTLASPRTFGGWGSGSTCFFIDPQRDLTFCFLSVGLMEDTYSVERFQTLADMIFSSFLD
ncbi:MAG: serine hydrolase domain-containing protein [Sphingobium sp.]|nr:serine hydrolase domain-containing protein [Sphingobium sp.]